MFIVHNVYKNILDVSITVDTIESCPTMRTLGTELSKSSRSVENAIALSIRN